MKTGEQGELFDIPKWDTPKDKSFKPLRYPIWTEKKAHLVERYLYYFVLITKHGTYIDGFAGPQQPDELDTWTAKKVLESEPSWLQDFFLFDDDDAQVSKLQELNSRQPPRAKNEPKRQVTITKGDFNQEVKVLLDSGKVSKRNAAFCLLDQRTFECHWSTVETLASYKESGLKIELFYFLPVLWLKRAIAALKERQKLELWWGRDDYESIRDLKPLDTALLVAKRLREELAYASAKPWPVFEKQNGGNVMYYMIHASDHPEAPVLMHRAYSRAVQPKETAEQLMLDMGYPPTESLDV
jgi:three-Cys-motif partner protein